MRLVVSFALAMIVSFLGSDCISKSSAQQPGVEQVVTQWESERAAATPLEVTLRVEVTEHKRKRLLGEGWIIPEDRRHVDRVVVLLHPKKGWYRIDTETDMKDVKAHRGVTVYYQNEFRSGSFPDRPGDTVSSPKVMADFVIASSGVEKYPIPHYLYPIF
ncbi:MAG: hypothetical protein MUF18_20030, partial [Fimbriiglobus sp.]|nr:hypothetical protein [Fimbriiglobus sp.]